MMPLDITVPQNGPDISKKSLNIFIQDSIKKKKTSKYVEHTFKLYWQTFFEKKQL